AIMYIEKKVIDINGGKNDTNIVRKKYIILVNIMMVLQYLLKCKLSHRREPVILHKKKTKHRNNDISSKYITLYSETCNSRKICDVKRLKNNRLFVRLHRNIMKLKNEGYSDRVYESCSERTLFPPMGFDNTQVSCLEHNPCQPELKDNSKVFTMYTSDQRRDNESKYNQPLKTLHKFYNVRLLALFLIGLSLVSGSAAESSPQFASPLRNLTVAAGRDARLSCVVENLHDYKVAWVHYGWRGRAVLTVHHQVITKNPRVSLLRERGGGVWTLVIANVTTTDQGGYMCQINTVPPAKIYGHITVLVPPVISTPPADVVAVEGEDVTLECEAQGDPEPTITWRREDGGEFSINHTQVSEAGGRSLLLNSVSRGDAGAYLCMASNTVPPAVSARAQLFVKYAPVLELGEKALVWKKLGEDAVLECHFQAWPTPTVVWTRESQLPGVAQDSGSQTVQGDGNVSDDAGPSGAGIARLLLRKVDSHHFGHYRCNVTNDMGSAVATLTLVETTTTSTTTTTTPSTTTATTTTTQRPSSAPSKGVGGWATAGDSGPYDAAVQEGGVMAGSDTQGKHSGPSSASWVPAVSSSTSQDASVPPIAGAKSDLGQHRYIQGNEPPSEPLPRPLHPEVKSGSASTLGEADMKFGIYITLSLFIIHLVSKNTSFGYC
ncbi:unnamed protein product, partial [Meganyctiphanes norvegica]